MGKKVKVVRKNNKKNGRTNDKRQSVSRLKSIIILLVVIVTLMLINSAINTFRWIKLAKEMGNVQNSTIVASSGEVLANIGEEKKTIYKTSENIPNNVKNAYISIEDQRFYSHIGIDVKRTGGAILTYIRKFGKSSFGGSTITQQLVKNLTGDSDRSIGRKVKEWGRAISLDTLYSKDEILTLYLNII